jgi:hypothetical protein
VSSLLEFSTQKFKEAEFFNELTESLRVYLLYCKYYREVFINAFSIQKFKEAEFFNELTQSLRVYLLFCK